MSTGKGSSDNALFEEKVHPKLVLNRKQIQIKINVPETSLKSSPRSLLPLETETAGAALDKRPLTLNMNSKDDLPFFEMLNLILEMDDSDNGNVNVKIVSNIIKENSGSTRKRTFTQSIRPFLIHS